MGNNVVVDDKDAAAPLAAFFFRPWGNIGGCETVTFSFLGLPLCFVIYTGSVELTIFIVIVTTARECRDPTGTHISCCKQK
jgi:hypothetical protein